MKLMISAIKQDIQREKLNFPSYRNTSK